MKPLAFMKPLVSVIIPVYNVRPYLREALDSVVEQTYKNLEIIVVDDGSNDGSEKICDEYEKLYSRIKLIHQKNLGVSAARNAGLDIMTGDYVAFLDPDDAFNLDMIEKMLKAVKENSADIAVCGFDVYYTDERMDGEKIKPRNSFLPDKEGIISLKEALNKLIDGRISFSVWDKFFARKLWDNVRFPVGHSYEEPWILQYIFENSKCICEVKQAVKNRIRMGGGTLSATQAHTLKHFKDYYATRKIIENYVVERTPEIFNPDVIVHLRDRHLISSILKCSLSLKAHPEDKKELQKMLQDILEDAKKKFKNSHYKHA